jgi:hypothetical protein
VSSVAIKPKRTHLELTSGRYLDYMDPRPEDICLADVALALANTCRWAGHCPHFYSVAEHACLVHDIVAERAARQHWTPALANVLQLAALHHDDHEAFVGDVPTPLKNMLGLVYTDLADKLDVTIGRALKLGWAVASFQDPEVKRADTLALYVEAERFKPSMGLHWEGRPDVVELPAGVTWACGLSPSAARNAYLQRHETLIQPR